MRPLLFLLLAQPLAARAQAEASLGHATPLDPVASEAVLAQAARQYPKFARALAAVRQDPLLKRVLVVQPSGPLASPAAASPAGTVQLDARFLEQSRPGFDDNRLVVVLYHEVGHLHYFATVPPGRRCPEASERAAFAYSLLKTRELATAGDCGPLRAGVQFMHRRSESGDLADPHVRALKALVQEPEYADYQRYAATQCPVD